MADERDEEIAALRARLDVLERGGAPAEPRPPPASPNPPLKAKDGSGCLIAVCVGLAAVVGLIALMAREPSLDAQAAHRAPARACDQKGAEAVTSLELGRRRLVRGADVTSDGLVVIVSPARWSALSLEQQKTLAAQFDCAIAGRDGHLKAVRFRAFRDSGDLTVFPAVDLLTLREQGYAD